MSSIFPFLPFESRTTYKKCESPPFMYIPMLGNVKSFDMDHSWYGLTVTDHLSKKLFSERLALQ